MEERPMQGLWGRYALFIVLSIGLLAANAYLMSTFAPPKAPGPEGAAQVARTGAKGAEKAGTPAVGPAAPAELANQAGGKPAAATPEPAKPEPAKAEAGKAEAAKAEAGKGAHATPKVVVAEPKVPDSWATLGSLDPSGPYRMLVALTSRGAAVRRIELSNPRFRELEDRSGYLGHVVVDEAVRGSGCPVQVVGHGTPAEQAGLVPGDSITAVDDGPVTGFDSLSTALRKTKPGQTVRLKIVRNGRVMELPATLSRRPLEVIRPTTGEDKRPGFVAPPSFLVALSQIDDQTAAAGEGAADAPKAAGAANAGGDIERELDGAGLRNVNWEVVSQDPSHVKYRRALPQWELEVFKTFRLAKVEPDDATRADAPDYHLTFDIEIRNTGKAARKVAYSVDGPNGLPMEGWWYASKVSRTWSASGLRDVVVSFEGDIHVLSAYEIGKGGSEPLQRSQPMSFVGVDAQYFASVLIPRRPDPGEVWFSQWQPLHYGVVEADRLNLTNASFRVISTVRDLKPGGAVEENFLIFAGPKRPDLLAQYDLGQIITYGWFGPVATLLLAILHGFYSVIPNYGVAIILLTVLVRSCMFPLSKKQALNAQKMQELQPEIKKIQEKYKTNMEARGKAQQELFRKHNYNPMGGCLVLFLQLPIFVGLYRGLMVDVELRQAPLLTESIRWASDLAAPDMLFDWSGFMPAFVTQGTGMFGLGPYFNLLPIITIVLFLWQQKKFMPPPADEQAAMQQRIMQFMMIFMGIMFFKVASGLCLYFIASSLWSVAERKFLPKTAVSGGGGPAATTSPQRPMSGRDGSPGSKRKVRGRRD
jgi:YidC/Oxa1 family membrane protein insertase